MDLSDLFVDFNKYRFIFHGENDLLLPFLSFIVLLKEVLRPAKLANDQFVFLIVTEIVL